MSKLATFEEKRTYTFTWELELDLNDTTTALKLPVEVPFAGDWYLSVKVVALHDLDVLLLHSNIEPGSLGQDVLPSAKLDWYEPGGSSGSIYRATWPHRPQYPAIGTGLNFSGINHNKIAAAHVQNNNFDPVTHRHYRVQFVFPVTMPLSMSMSIIRPSALARRTHGESSPLSLAF
jgi:hypothetical protein